MSLSPAQVTGSSETRSLTRARRVRWAWRVLTWLLAFNILVLLNSGQDTPSSSGSESGGISRFFTPAAWYSLLADWLKKPSFQHVVVVTLGSNEPQAMLASQCGRRALFADTLRAVQRLAPAVVAVDYAFDPHGCEDERVNDSLVDALNDTEVPVVLGRGAYRLADLREESPAELVKVAPLGFTEHSLLLREDAGFSDINPQVTSGLVEINADSRKIPLTWSVMVNDRSRATAQVETLSVLAALRFPGDKNSPLLSKLARRKPDTEPLKHPLTTLIPEQQTPIISGLSVLCAPTSPVRSKYVNYCASDEAPADDTTLVHGKVALLGYLTPSDLHESAIGRVPGVFLQANYIESLLDGRAWRPIPTFLQILIAGGWIVFVELTLQRFCEPWWKALCYPVVIIMLAWAVFVGFILMLGFYAELFLPTVLVIVAKHVGDQVENGLSTKEV